MSAGGDLTIRVTGMKELRAAVKQLSDVKPYQTAIRLANKAGAERVAKAAKASASGSRMGHVAAGSIKPRAGQQSSKVVAGSGVPWYGGHEFGSHRFKQFPPTKAGGYHLYPALAANRDDIIKEYVHQLDGIIKQAFG